MNNTEQIQNRQLNTFLLPNAGETYINQEHSIYFQPIDGDTFKTTGVNYRASGNLLICREISKSPSEICNVGGRGHINSFSVGSGRRMRSYLRECTSDYTQMLTLTYPAEYPCDGAICKEHLRRFLQEIQREFNRQNHPDKFLHSSFWFLEFQQRGAPHFHIFTNWSPNKQWVALKWFDIVGSKDEKHYRAGTRTEFLRCGRAGTISYASKYAAKMAQKEAPKGFLNIGRWWGVYGVRKVVSADVYVSRSDFSNNNVKKRVLLLKEELERLVFEKKARILKREQGFLLVLALDKESEKIILHAVLMLEAATGDIGDMFDDAEVDYGACYSR